MGKTNAKGEIGEAMILADLQRQGHGIAIPFGHDLPFDLIVVRKENGALEKVQCKYTTSNGKVVFAKVTSTSAWVQHRYTRDEVDWIAVYDATTDQCFYLPSSEWDGQGYVNLRLTSTANGQSKGIRFARDFKTLVGDPRIHGSCGSASPLPLRLDFPPE
jgi:PD-(D/E)XK endonuclease